MKKEKEELLKPPENPGVRQLQTTDNFNKGDIIFFSGKTQLF